MEEAAEETVKLHDFAHAKTEECFNWIFSGPVLKKLKAIEEIPF